MPRRREERPRVLGPYKLSTGVYRVTTLDPGANKGQGGRRDRQFGSYEEAEQCRQEIEAQLERLLGRTISEALGLYEDYLIEKGTGEISWKETLRRLHLFFPDTELQLAHMTEDKARHYYARFREGRSVDYHRNTLAEAKSFLRWCVSQHMIKQSPLEHVGGVGRRSAGKKQLTGDEAIKLYQWCIWRAHRGDEAAIAVLMLLLMALRQGDVIKRNVRDVDLDGTRLRIEGGKTEKSNRPRRIPGVLPKMLKRVRQGRDGSEPLFKAEGGGYHTTSWLRAAMRRFCKAAGVPYVCPHGLKGTAGTLAIEAGAMAEQVADYLSHESKNTTTRHYIAPGAEDSGAIAARITVLAGGKR